MDYNPKIHYIPARPKPIKRVGIYCRVSSSKDEQLKSLSNQISGLIRKVANIPSWRIMDMYVEIRSAKGETNRSELNRLIVDCKNDKLDIVVLREVSRLGRDTVETLENYRAVRNSVVCVIFDKVKRGELRVYYNPTNIPIPIPIPIVSKIQEISIFENEETEVKIDGEVFFKSVTRVRKSVYDVVIQFGALKNTELDINTIKDDLFKLTNVVKLFNKLKLNNT